MDPSFSVLLGDTSDKGPCEELNGNEENKGEKAGVNKKIIYSVVFSVVGAAAILTALIVASPKYLLLFYYLLFIHNY